LVPTFVELGFSDIVLDTDHLLLAPAGTLPDVIERLAKTHHQPKLHSGCRLSGSRLGGNH